MRMRRGLWLASPFQALEYKSVSYSAIALLARHGLLAFCRLRQVPGRKAMRLVDRPLEVPT